MDCSPLDLDGKPMPMEAFRDLYRVPGFKYEYMNGRAEISVQRSAHATVAAPAQRILEHTDPSLPEDIDVESASGALAGDLESLWVNAFVRTSDYYRWAVEDIQDDAQGSLDTLFGEEKALHPASLLAHWKGDIVAALLVNRNKTRPLIDVLCARRDLRRRGVAGALVHRVARRLKKEGAEDRMTLCSGYLLANRESASWHEAVGFVELPDWLVLIHRYRCLQHNLRRGLVWDVFGAKRRAESLQATLGEMKEKRRSDQLAYSPSRWLTPKEKSSGGNGSSRGSRIDAYLETYFDRLDGLEPV